MKIVSIFMEMKLKILGAKINIGKNNITNLIVRMRRSATTVNIGDRLNVRAGVVFNISCGELYIGKNVFLNDSSKINVRDFVRVEDGVIIGQNVLIYDHDHDYQSDNMRRSYKTAPVIIGENSWIGSGAIILKGTKIGKNCVVGAGSVVKGEIPDNTIYYEKRERVQKLIQLPEN